MTKKKLSSLIIILAAAILLAGTLFAVNRDLFRYTYDLRLERDFTAEIARKQDYVIAGPIALKPGAYVFTPILSVEGNGSGIFLIDGDEQELFYEDLTDGMTNPEFPFEISGGTKQVRFGIRYDPARSTVHIQRIRVTAEHILYRDSLLRHLTLSLLVILLAVWLVLRLCYPQILWKLFPAFSKPANERALALLILLTLITCYPLLNPERYVHNTDMFFHVTRIKGLAESLRAGYFPVRDQLYWLHNYGYGVGFFYPDVFLYFPALLVLLGFDLLTAYNVFLVLCTFASVASMWYAALRISGKRSAAAASAVMMAFAAYPLFNLHYRGTVGETQAAVFYPLIILGLYEIFYGDKKRWPIFAFGFLGLLCCHIISLTIASVLTLVFVLTQVRKLFHDREILTALLKSVLLVVCVGAFFWLPMLEQSFTNPQLNVNQLLSGEAKFNRFNYAIPVENLLIRFKPWSQIYQSASVYPGWTLLLVPLLRVLVWKTPGKRGKAADIMLIFSLPLLWMCTRAFPWQWKIFLPLVTRIQFAYRLLLPATVLLCLSGGIYVSILAGKLPERLSTGKRDALCLMVLGLFCFFSTAFPILRDVTTNHTVEKQQFIMQDNRVSGGEYLPVGMASDFPGKNADTVLLSESDVPLTITAHKRQGLGFSFSYELPEDSGSVRFSLPLIYYTGFQGTLTAEDGSVIHPDISPDERGLVSLNNGGISRGSVSVTYQKTAVQIVSECLSLLSVLFLGNLWVRNKKRTA